MFFGADTPEADAHTMLNLAAERGVNCFDTAEMYPVPQSMVHQGQSEVVLGNWLQNQRRYTALWCRLCSLALCAQTADASVSLGSKHTSAEPQLLAVNSHKLIISVPNMHMRNLRGTPPVYLQTCCIVICSSTQLTQLTIWPSLLYPLCTQGRYLGGHQGHRSFWTDAVDPRRADLLICTRHP